MKLIIGLGNPGDQYQDTRHNAGILALGSIAAAWEAGPFERHAKLKSAVAKARKDSEVILLARPETFMNNSGEAVHALLQFYKLTPGDLLVLHDDMDIASGAYRFTASSRAAGHNGVADLIERLGTQDFARLRIGIGRPEDVLGACQPGHDFVLGRFTEPERTALEALFPRLLQEAENFVSTKKTALL